MTLLEVQRRMANAIFQPLTRSDRMAGGADAEFIKPNNRLTSLERLEIYSRSYWFRILDSLYDDFPGCAPCSVSETSVGSRVPISQIALRARSRYATWGPALRIGCG
jgi:hypothetical protein